MEFIKIAKSNLRSDLKKKLSQMSVSEIAEQSKIITCKVRYYLSKSHNFVLHFC